MGGGGALPGWCSDGGDLKDLRQRSPLSRRLSSWSPSRACSSAYSLRQTDSERAGVPAGEQELVLPERKELAPPVMGEKSSSAATHSTPSSSTSSAPHVPFPSTSPPCVADPAAAGFPHHHSRSCRYRVPTPPGAHPALSPTCSCSRSSLNNGAWRKQP